MSQGRSSLTLSEKDYKIRMEQIVRPIALHFTGTTEKSFALLKFRSSSVLVTSVEFTANILKPIMDVFQMSEIVIRSPPYLNSCNMDLWMKRPPIRNAVATSTLSKEPRAWHGDPHYEMM